MLGGRCAEVLYSRGLLAGIVLPPRSGRRRMRIHPITFLSAAVVVLARKLHEAARSIGLKQSGSLLSLNEFLASHRDVPLLELEESEQVWQAAIGGFVPADILLSCSFPRKLPIQVGGLKHCLNLHPGMLPGNRGPNPIFWSLQKGDSELALTLHRLSVCFDTGEILTCASVESSQSLSEFGAEARLCSILESFLPRALETLEQLQQDALIQEHGIYRHHPAVSERAASGRLSIVRLNDISALLGLPSRRPGSSRWN